MPCAQKNQKLRTQSKKETPYPLLKEKIRERHPF
jgi:hypothetical protein